MDHELNFQVELSDYYNLFEAVAGLELARRKLRHTFKARFGYVAQLPKEISERKLIASETDTRRKSREELREWDEGLVLFSTEHRAGEQKYMWVYGFFSTEREAEQSIARISKLLPPEIDRSDSGKAVLSFWNAVVRTGDHRPERESKLIAAPRWREIAANYPAGVRKELGHVMELGSPEGTAGSGLMLWRGLPGTGKTWAVRALAREWGHWCNFHYVIDPAAFFTNARYMLNLLSKLDEVSENQDEAEQKWNLLVLEDAGEFIATDSRQQHGQALAKLLNLTDGLFGQGLRLMVLITTNEEVRNLHPAIIRNGRCLTNLHFPEFNEAEACEWFALHGGGTRCLGRGLALADLFAALHEGRAIANTTSPKRAGFTAR
jgi:hypothetical protein